MISEEDMKRSEILYDSNTASFPSLNTSHPDTSGLYFPQGEIKKTED